MLNLADFKENRDSIAYTVSVDERPLKININQKKGTAPYKISVYATGINTTYITQSEDFKEVDKIVTNICKNLELIYSVSDSPNLQKFIDKLRDEYETNRRHKRLRLVSADGKVEMFVEKNREGWYALVWDTEINEKERRKGQLAPLCATEEEAIRLVEKAMNEYEMNGYYKRSWVKYPTNQFLYEERSVNPLQTSLEETYSIDNLSKEKYEFLLKQSEIFDNLNGDN